MMNELDKIKKYYGEEMMHFCRNSFSTILDTNNMLFDILYKNFAPSKFLYNDIKENHMSDEFRNYINSFAKGVVLYPSNNKTPYELMDEAGYILYECKSEKDIQRFEKYYEFEERLCTFNGKRLENCNVFFAVKKNIEKYRREDFKKPRRQDEYGTSVLSIQFQRGRFNTLSIKNRYNHRVNNPDATFSNNLENIIPGLTLSFEEMYGYHISIGERLFELDGYVRDCTGKYFKVNHNIHNLFYGPNNVVIEDISKKIHSKYLEKEKYIIMDYFFVDLVNKKIGVLDDKINDSFEDEFYDIKNIRVKKIKDGNKRIIVTKEDGYNVIIEIDKLNRIISYINKNIKKIRDDFLTRNTSLKHIEIPNVEEIGKNFLYFNTDLEIIEIPNVKKIGSKFIYSNKIIKHISLPNVINIDSDFLWRNVNLTEINFPKLETVSINFIYSNRNIEFLNMPNLYSVKMNFLCKNRKLTVLKLEKLYKVGAYFLNENRDISKIYLPNLTIIGDAFLFNNLSLDFIDLPSAVVIKNSFLYSNENIVYMNLPNVKNIANFFMYNNKKLSNIVLENLLEIRNDFMPNNISASYIKIPNVKTIGNSFFEKNVILDYIDLNRVNSVGSYFLYSNSHIAYYNLDNLESAEEYFLYSNESLSKDNFKKLKYIGSKSFYSSKKTNNIFKRLIKVRKHISNK